MPPEQADIPGRRAGAPRLIDWTGERCVPWASDAQVVYEHLHRYLWAAPLVADRRVLDLASGEGFGAAILARLAASVVGVDVDEQTVEHSRLNYERDNLTFEVGDAHDLSRLEDGSFGAIVAFEMIEHVEDQERVFDEVRRVLAPEGILIISTPDREAYQQASPDNPYHVRELDREEFVQLLGSRFAHVSTFGQRTITGSAVAALEDSDAEAGSDARSFFIQQRDGHWQVNDGLAPLYIVAVASDGALPPMPHDSTLADPEIALVREVEAKRAETLRELAVLRREVAALRSRAAQDQATIAMLDGRLNDATQRLRRIEDSVTWQMFQRVRARLFRLLGGEQSQGVRLMQAGLRLIGRKLPGRSPGQRPAITLARPSHRPGEPIGFDEASEPEVSIVMPLYAHAELTEAALASIREHTHDVGYEVILVDDSDDLPTKALLERVRGARVVTNETNLGYLRSVNRGAEIARGRWLVLCNNDVEAQPGWLAALLECGKSRSDTAVVAPKFVYPDSSVAEAGGIIWRDATGANYGRGEDPTDCHYEYGREIDYGSAAALLVRADFWRDIGGFDERFAPMYYEDTDLCFEARNRGLRVMYEPRALVVHVEGATAGVDENAGHKRNQEANRPKFVDKWQSVLETQHLENSPRNLWLAANLRSRARVLVVDHRVPTWDRDSGGLRMLGMLAALLDLGCHVSLLPDNGFAIQPYTRELQRMGVEVLYGPDWPMELPQKGWAQSLVILSRAEVADRWLEQVRTLAPAVPVAFDTVDLHWLREERRAERGANGGSPSSDAVAMRELEVSLIRAANATLVVTDEERAHVLRDVPDTTVHVVPNVHRVREPVRPPDQRRDLLFVGGFEHPPNTDAALTLIGDVMPHVWRTCPDVRVKIVGADAPDAVTALASRRVEVTGWVADLDPLLDAARVMVAPLTYGAGLKGKVTQALAYGLPVVTTPVGAEGLDAVDGEHMLIAEVPQELAEQVVRLLHDDELWRRLSASGQQLIAERCSPEVMRERLGGLLDELLPPDAAARPTPVMT